MNFCDEWLQNCGEGNPKYPHGFTLISSTYLQTGSLEKSWILAKASRGISGVKPPWSFRFLMANPWAKNHSKWDAKPDHPAMNLGVIFPFLTLEIWWYRKSNKLSLFQPWFHLFSPPTWRDVLPHLSPSPRHHSSEWPPSLTTKALSFPHLAWVSAHPSLQYLSSWPPGTPGEGDPRWWPKDGSWWQSPLAIYFLCSEKCNMLMKVLVFFLMSQVGIASFYLVNLFFFRDFLISKNNIFR